MSGSRIFVINKLWIVNQEEGGFTGIGTSQSFDSIGNANLPKFLDIDKLGIGSIEQCFAPIGQGIFQGNISDNGRGLIIFENGFIGTPIAGRENTVNNNGHKKDDNA